MTRREISFFTMQSITKPLLSNRYLDILVECTLLQLDSSHASYALQSLRSGGRNTMLKNFVMFLHLLNILLKIFYLCRKKSRKVLTHTKEIQAFQNYFETAYRPDDLSRTIRETVVTLKEKISKKMENLKIPSYVPPEKRYEMAFKMHPLTFPRLPNTDFGVALAPPFPDWFICGDYVKILR